MKYLFYLLAVILFVSCSDTTTEDYRSTDNKINIYWVITNDEFMHREKVDLESLQLEGIPWVKSLDIAFYDWSAHAFYLNKEVEKAKYSARNFVVASGDKRLFMGVFWPMFMSSIPMIPAIMPEDDLWTPKDVIRFTWFGWHFPGELKNNPEFRSELINSELLREGIKVEIIKLRKRNASALDYTFQVTNLDTENIYVLDPNKMGASRFHYYCNGVYLQQGEKYFSANNSNVASSDKIRSNWYYKLGPGKSITRTVKADGFPLLPSGQVKASLRFPGATHLKAREWKKKDGRIWIGDYLAETEILIQ